MVRVLMRLGFAALFATLGGVASAATITPSDGQGMGCAIRIDGPIANGDARRLRDVIDEVAPQRTSSRLGHRICLYSAGGSLVEAVRMAEIVAENVMGTAVPEDAVCESACAILFLAGKFGFLEGEGSEFPDRVLHPRGTLGFHAPALLIEDRSYGRDEVNKAYSIALGSMGEILRLRSQLAVDVPDSLFLTILNTPASEMTYVETVEQAARWKIEVAPVALTAEDIEAALRHACLNADGGLLDTHVSDSYLYGSANLEFSYSNLDDASAVVTSQQAFRGEGAADCEMTLFGSNEPLDRLGYLYIEGGHSNENTRREVFPYLFHDPRLPLSALPVARTEAETGERIFFAAIGAAARNELSSVEIQSCWLLRPEARIVNVNEYVNLRSGPGFEAEVLRQVPLGEQVRVIATQDLRAPSGGTQARRCLEACNELAADTRSDALRRRVNACISDNVFWYEIRDRNGMAGYVSRKFLGD